MNIQERLNLCIKHKKETTKKLKLIKIKNLELIYTDI